MRIGYITTAYPDMPDHPRGIFVRRAAEALVNGGEEVRVVAPGSDRAPNRETWNGVVVHRIPYWFAGGQTLTRDISGIMPALEANPLDIIKVLPLVGGLYWAARRMARWADVLHAHWIIPCGVIAGVISQGKGKPAVVTAHGGDVRLARNWTPAEALTRYALTKTSHIWTNSPLHRDWLVQFDETGSIRWDPIGIPMSVYSNAIPLTEASSHRVAAWFEERSGSELGVLFVGGLSKRKSVDTLLESVSLLPKSVSLRLAIIGDGPQAIYLDKIIEDKDLGTVVRRTGARPPDEVASWMRAADVLVLPSVGEPWGSVVPEAMAAGTPVIVSETAGSAELVEQGVNGWTVTERSPKQLADSLKDAYVQLVFNDENWTQSAQRAVREHGRTTEARAKRHLAVYQKIRKWQGGKTRGSRDM